MTPPKLITPPTVPVVALADLRAHLRVDAADEDALIVALETSAVAYLDGWTGVLGRAIRPQVWRQTFDAGECVRLAMPDVTATAVTARDAAGDVVSVTTTLVADHRGPVVKVTGAYATLQVDYTCEMPPTLLPAAQVAVKLLVAHWFANREAVGGQMAEVPLTVDALVTALRWQGA